ncbi:hypothetical protein GC173_07540 [bacterium]|nr:hypothetical protein [bacterium]
MAKTEAPPEQDINEVVRERLKGLVRSLWIIVPACLLAYAGYMLYFGTNPRKELRTVDQTLASYTSFVAPFSTRAGGRPNPKVVNDWLTFFDADSRRFFEDNVDGIAFTLFQFRPEEFKELSHASRREQAMIAVVSRPPMNGIARVIEQRPIGDGAVALQVMGISSEHRIQMKPGDYPWCIMELGGLRTQFLNEIEAQKSLRPK